MLAPDRALVDEEVSDPLMAPGIDARREDDATEAVVDGPYDVIALEEVPNARSVVFPKAFHDDIAVLKNPNLGF